MKWFCLPKGLERQKLRQFMTRSQPSSTISMIMMKEIPRKRDMAPPRAEKNSDPIS